MLMRIFQYTEWRKDFAASEKYSIMESICVHARLCLGVVVCFDKKWKINFNIYYCLFRKSLVIYIALRTLIVAKVVKWCIQIMYRYVLK